MTLRPAECNTIATNQPTNRRETSWPSSVEEKQEQPWIATKSWKGYEIEVRWTPWIRLITVTAHSHKHTNPNLKRWPGNLLQAYDEPHSHLDLTYYRLMNLQSLSDMNFSTLRMFLRQWVGPHACECGPAIPRLIDQLVGKKILARHTFHQRTPVSPGLRRIRWRQPDISP